MKPLSALLNAQADGANPLDNAWVSASAGTGKTQVLSARVLRLLLDRAAPDRILCLTFTKAGAAEMQARIFDRLAHWVRASEAELRADLAAIRADTSPDALDFARTLFAHTLDARGGLRVQTIHAYAQSLLASFPVEAGVAPGFATLADRDAVALRGRILAETIQAAHDDPGFLADVGAISVARGESAFDRIAGVLIRHAGAIAELGAPSGFVPRLRRAFGLPGEGSAAEIVEAHVAGLDHAGLRRLALALQRDGGKIASERADIVLWWLGCAASARGEHCGTLLEKLLNKDGTPPKTLVPASAKKADPSFVALGDTLCAALVELAELRRLLDAVDNAARHLRVGARLGGAYAEHKRRAGVIDYDDMIARAAALLETPGMGDWVRYKLDARINHLLVDEAQDTNVAQWQIVEALSDEFFDGSGARDMIRTLFVVGDFKQAIFAFQGSDPRVFDAKREAFAQRIADAKAGWQAIDLETSFRSVPAVLDVVEKVLETLGHAELGTANTIPPARAARKQLPGVVTLWPPLGPPGDDDEPPADEPRRWLPPAQVRMAHALAGQIAAWLDPVTGLDLPARQRRVRPDDILVLVRNRGEFVQPLVAALHQFGVPVAGADRLRLTEPIAVQDLLAVIRFVLQPGDDLTCATLLMSPFIGLDHAALFTLAHARPGTLWDRVRASGGAAADWLGTVLGLADFSAPYEFLETILSGQLGGRRKLLARLGEEAREAIEAVLSQALAFEIANAPTLQGFLAWMEGADTDIKRDPDAPLDAVRIMTVHGAKGLQAPVVVLADAARGRDDRDDHVLVEIGDAAHAVPIFHGGKIGKVGRIGAAAEAAATAQMHEHWRLLYVALTRAEDLLFIGGALGKSDTLPPESWHAVVGIALGALEAVSEPDGWGETIVYRACMDGVPVPDAPRAAVHDMAAALPDWATTPAPAEAQPPRPLSPSAIAADDIAMPPPTPAMQAAALRGQRLHALFERLPQVAPGDRAAAAARWLAAHACDLDATAREVLAATALAIVADARFADLFGADALAEAPIAAVVEGIVIAGKVDRLLVRASHVQIVDFKTGTRVPADAAAVEPYHLRQMAAYVAALGAIFPGRAVDAALLYTHDATLIELPAALLADHKPRLGQAEARLG